jgi:hypothetical protein
MRLNLFKLNLSAQAVNLSSKIKTKGYVLPLTVGLGMAMIMMGLTATMMVQTDRAISQQRRQNGVSLAIAEGAADRVLAMLSSSGNSVLLGRNYDPINPNTGTNYLGADAAFNSGDETNMAVDEWTGYNPSTAGCAPLNSTTAFVAGNGNNMTTSTTAIVGNTALTLNQATNLSSNIGNTGTYKILAYRYNPVTKTGTLLVEGRHNTRDVAVVALTLKISSEIVGDFPGIASVTTPGGGLGVVGLRGRVALGANAHIFYPASPSGDPTTTGIAILGSPNRTSHLRAIWSGVNDGVTADRVQGKLVACSLSVAAPVIPPVGSIKLSGISNNLTLPRVANEFRNYTTNEINLKNNETLTVDTTAGPVTIFVDDKVKLTGNAKILNVRTDGKMPRAGDLRIIAAETKKASIQLFDTSCIQNAFLLSLWNSVELLTTGPGCPGGRNTNIEGVVWAESIAAAKQDKPYRDVNDPSRIFEKINDDKDRTPGVTSGIYVPDELTGLADMSDLINLPVKYRLMGIEQWRQVRL